MTQHTPGPWEIFEDRRTVKTGRQWVSVPTHSIWPQRNGQISETPDDIIADRVDDPTNARLIAAAPKMLEALQAVAARLEPDPYYSSIHEIVRAAIKQATGE